MSRNDLTRASGHSKRFTLIGGTWKKVKGGVERPSSRRREFGVSRAGSTLSGTRSLQEAQSKLQLSFMGKLASWQAAVCDRKVRLD